MKYALWIAAVVCVLPVVSRGHEPVLTALAEPAIYSPDQSDDVVLSVSELSELTGLSAECSCCESDCCGRASLCSRPALTNGLWGVGMPLAEHGIGIKSSLTQFYQSVASGGEEQAGRYGAKFDLYVDFNTRGWLVISPDRIIAPVLGEQQGSWAAAHIGEQRIWQDCHNQGRYTNLRGMVGFADEYSSLDFQRITARHKSVRPTATSDIRKAWAACCGTTIETLHSNLA